MNPLYLIVSPRVHRGCCWFTPTEEVETDQRDYRDSPFLDDGLGLRLVRRRS